MDLKNTFRVGVIGAGNFGKAISKLLSKNVEVFIYAHTDEDISLLKSYQSAHNPILPLNVKPTRNILELVSECKVILPVVPALAFRKVIRDISMVLDKDHIIIHGTKGLDLSNIPLDNLNDDIEVKKDDIITMSKVILDETCVDKVGCLSGPNLANEIVLGQPTATVVSSANNEVISIGQFMLNSDIFKVYSNNDILGTELCGVLKNIISIASGCLNGLGLGDNIRGVLISKGIAEMITIGTFLGGSINPFLGLPGIGDLVATCSSNLSRNYSLGYHLAKGNTLNKAINFMQGNTIEGIKSVKIIGSLVAHHNIDAPITNTLYKVLFKNLPVTNLVDSFISYNSTNSDVNFI